MFWMKHSVHGVIPVYDAATVEYNKKQGWELFEPETTVEIDPEIPEEIDLDEPVQKRRGRPPKDAE